MGFDDLLGMTNISASGMAAEQQRMGIEGHLLDDGAVERLPRERPALPEHVAGVLENRVGFLPRTAGGRARRQMIGVEREQDGVWPEGMEGRALVV